MITLSSVGANNAFKIKQKEFQFFSLEPFSPIFVMQS